MKTTNFIFFMFLFIAIPGQIATSEVSGVKIGYNIQRKLQSYYYISIKNNQNQIINQI